MGSVVATAVDDELPPGGDLLGRVAQPRPGTDGDAGPEQLGLEYTPHDGRWVAPVARGEPVHDILQESRAAHLPE